MSARRMMSVAVIFSRGFSCSRSMNACRIIRRERTALRYSFFSAMGYSQRRDQVVVYTLPASRESRSGWVSRSSMTSCREGRLDQGSRQI